MITASSPSPSRRIQLAKRRLRFPGTKLEFRPHNCPGKDEPLPRTNSAYSSLRRSWKSREMKLYVRTEPPNPPPKISTKPTYPPLCAALHNQSNENVLLINPHLPIFTVSPASIRSTWRQAILFRSIA